MWSAIHGVAVGHFDERGQQQADADQEEGGKVLWNRTDS